MFWWLIRDTDVRRKDLLSFYLNFASLWSKHLDQTTKNPRLIIMPPLHFPSACSPKRVWFLRLCRSKSVEGCTSLVRDTNLAAPAPVSWPLVTRHWDGRARLQRWGSDLTAGWRRIPHSYWHYCRCKLPDDFDNRACRLHFEVFTLGIR